jgi:hypothetical protein
MIALTLFTAQAQARTGGPFGLGLILGDPTALSVKYDSTAHDAFDAGLAFNVDKWILVYGDYQYKFADTFSRTPGLSNIMPYLGVGLVLVASNHSLDDTRHYQYFSESTSSKVALGIRVPFGLEWRPDAPIGVFAELAPGISVIPGTVGFLQGGLGIRYFF